MSDIPLITESREVLFNISEEEARALLAANRGRIIRDGAGRMRRVILIADKELPLVGQSKIQAIISYTGTAKWVYMEEFESGRRCPMLKKFNPNRSAGVKWNDTEHIRGEGEFPHNLEPRPW